MIAPNGVTPRDDDLPWWWFPQEEAIFGFTDRLDLIEPNGWGVAIVGKAIEEVVTANGHAKIFEVGREFARLIDACNGFDAELKRQLAGRPSVLAYNRLEQEGGPVPIYGDDDAYECEVRAYFERWSHASAAAWLAFGDVVGVLREVDLATLGKDCSLPSLRAFQLRADSSSDAVRAAICLAERELADERNSDHQPKNIVASISHGIEALTKRLWAKDFPTDRDGHRGLLTVLGEKQRSEDALEARLGAVARTLYITYRNPICHDFDAYSCTWADARFFVAGMRLLLDISEQLVQQRRN